MADAEDGEEPCALLASHAGGAGSKAGGDKMFSLKKWNAVAMWSWDVECDTCAICRVQVMGKRAPGAPGPAKGPRVEAPACSESSGPGMRRAGSPRPFLARVRPGDAFRSPAPASFLDTPKLHLCPPPGSAGLFGEGHLVWHLGPSRVDSGVFCKQPHPPGSDLVLF